MEDSRCSLSGFCSPGSLKDPTSAGPARDSRNAGVLYPSGTAVAIRKSAEPQMQRMSMYLAKTLRVKLLLVFRFGEPLRLYLQPA